MVASNGLGSPSWSRSRNNRVTGEDEALSGSSRTKAPKGSCGEQLAGRGLWVREAAGLAPAPDEDLAVVRGYDAWSDKGETGADGRRLTIMTARRTYHVGEAVRVIHVFEATRAGTTLYLMGPKTVYGEHVDGQLASEAPPDWSDPFAPPTYNGRTLASPGVDHNYDVTSYLFKTPGCVRIQWQLGGLKSNVIELTVTA
jgi:hypothetical protein